MSKHKRKKPAGKTPEGLLSRRLTLRRTPRTWLRAAPRLVFRHRVVERPKPPVSGNRDVPRGARRCWPNGGIILGNLGNASKIFRRDIPRSIVRRLFCGPSTALRWPATARATLRLGARPARSVARDRLATPWRRCVEKVMALGHAVRIASLYEAPHPRGVSVRGVPAGSVPVRASHVSTGTGSAAVPGSRREAGR